MFEMDQPSFLFVSRAFPEETFSVVDFVGVEGLSMLYEFTIRLVSEREDLDLEAAMARTACFTIRGRDGDVPFNGILSEFEQLHQAHGLTFYRAVLVPKVWKLRLTRRHQVFLAMDVPEIIETALKDGGLTADDYSMRTMEPYPTREYVCQYGESHLDFACRWMEHYGLYYYFTQGDEVEKLVVTDTRLSHKKRGGFPNLVYAPPSGLEPSDEDNLIHEFTARHQRVPQGVLLRDYNYRRPSLDLTAEAPVASEGKGVRYSYGDHFQTPEDGQELAKVRAQEILAGRTVFNGHSRAPFISPGFTYTLEGHFRERFNADYLVTEVRHQGSQTRYLTAGMGMAGAFREESLQYSNQFKAIAADVQFRPERQVPRPHIHGCVNGFVDASGSGEYAELDHEGRYKIRLPFDLAGHTGGKASHWIRMAQPYAGPGYGFHCPLHKDCEVLVTFIDGHPDRPVIAGAVPNPQNSSPVTDGNLTKNLLHTAGKNRFEMNDEAGNERILMHTPQADTWVRLGAPNDPGTEEGDDGWWGNSEHDMGFFCKKAEFKIFRNVTSLTIGGSESMVGGGELLFVGGYKLDIKLLFRVLIELPRRWGLNYAETKTGMGLDEAQIQRLDVADAKIAAINNDAKGLGDRTKLLNSKVKAVNNQARAIGQRTEALNEAVKAYNGQRAALGQKTQALNEAINAANIDQANLASRVEALSTETTAVNTKTREAATAIESAPQMSDITTMRVRDGEVIVKF